VTAPVIMAALFAAAAVGTGSYRLIGPRRGIARQVAPYTAAARSRLGLHVAAIPEPLFSGEVVRRVLGPLGTVISAQLNKLLGLGDSQALELRLRQAGQPWTADEYRRLHMKWAILAPIASTVVGWLLGTTFMIVLFLAGGIIFGARHMPDKLKGKTKRRTARMRSDIPTVAWMIAPRIRNRMSLTVAVADVAAHGTGPVIDDLHRALDLVERGTSEVNAYELIAHETIEPTAARFYELLAVATTGGINLVEALRELARETRTRRREEVERSAAKRQIAMVLPDLAFMAPVLMLFLLAPVPRLLFGGH
jgi:tight adherence protein C